ncbi:MAG: hypothetical protein QOI41_2212 [Myxococcales bacterium]|nr:hypothetical protein [Myxococcales bacterium]
MLVWLAYLAVALVFTWPLAANLATALPGDGADAPIFLWDEWWFRYALTHHASVFSTGHLFVPTGAQLAFHTFTPLNGLLSVPLAPLVGPVRAHNLLVLWSWATAGWGTYALAARFARSKAARLFAGFVFAFCPYRFAHLLGHVNLTSTQWIPLFALALLAALEARTPRRAGAFGALAGALLAANVYTEMTYVLFSGIVGAALVVHALVRRPRLAIIVSGLVACAVTVVMLSLPFLLAASATGTMASLATPTSTHADAFSANLYAYALPSPMHPLFGATTRRLCAMPEGALAETTVFPGYATWLFALVAFSRLRGARDPLAPWLALVVLFLALSLGPLLHAGTEMTSWWMPYRLVDDVPFLRNARAPSRFSVVAILGLAMAATAGLEAVTTWCRRARYRAVVVGTAFLVAAADFLAIPFPMHELPPSQALASLATAPDGALLSIPIGARTAFDEWGIFDSNSLYEQTLHRKPVFGGMVARLSPTTANAATGLPVVRDLLALEANRPLAAPTERAAARRFAREVGVRYVAVHAPFVGTAAERFLLDRLSLVEIAADAGAVVYRVDERLDDDSRNAHPVRALEGWYDEEHAADGARWRWMGERSRMEVTAAAPRAEGDRFCLRLSGWAIRDGIELAVTVGGAKIGRFVAPPGHFNRVFVAPRAAGAAQAEVTLAASGVVQGSDPRALSFALTGVSLRATFDGDLSCAPDHPNFSAALRP